MSQLQDLTDTVKEIAASSGWNETTAANHFISIMRSLDWDIMPFTYNETDPDQAILDEIKEAKRMLSYS